MCILGTKSHRKPFRIIYYSKIWFLRGLMWNPELHERILDDFEQFKITSTSNPVTVSPEDEDIIVHSKMAAGCCGVKKQKLNNSMPAICCHGSTVHPNHHHGKDHRCSKHEHPNHSPAPNHYNLIVRPEMCYFCYEVLINYLNNSSEQAKTPSFTNDR